MHIDDAEGNQPAHHRADDQHPDIEVQGDFDHLNQSEDKGVRRVHAASLAGNEEGGKTHSVIPA